MTRNESDAEKEGLRQTLLMLQQEMGNLNASLSEVRPQQVVVTVSRESLNTGGSSCSY